jgi:hypothetical protein
MHPPLNITDPRKIKEIGKKAREISLLGFKIKEYYQDTLRILSMHIGKAKENLLL